MPTTGIYDILNENIKIYPNPTKNKLHIEINDRGKQKIYLVQLSDLMGRLLHSSQVSKEQIEIDMGGYTSGIYLLKIIDDSGGQVTQKVIKD
jgi:hypothetical protein